MYTYDSVNSPLCICIYICWLQLLWHCLQYWLLQLIMSLYSSNNLIFTWLRKFLVNWYNLINFCYWVSGSFYNELVTLSSISVWVLLWRCISIFKGQNHSNDMGNLLFSNVIKKRRASKTYKSFSFRILLFLNKGSVWAL